MMTLRPALILTLTLLASPVLAEVTVTGQSLDVELVAADALPPAPTPSGDMEACGHLFLTDPATAGGQVAATKGWLVTGELPLGDLTAVSFVADAYFVGSGACEVTDGNVGFFQGDRLVALLYGTDAESLMIGWIRPFGTGLRVLTGDALPGASVDLAYDGATLALSDPAREEPVCNGAANVPGIEGLPIDEARKLVMAQGWQPIPGNPEDQAFGIAADLAGLGVPEVESCAGTGFGFCAYAYQGPVGSLRVITAGEGGESGGLPIVSGYDVACN